MEQKKQIMIRYPSLTFKNEANLIFENEVKASSKRYIEGEPGDKFTLAKVMSSTRETKRVFYLQFKKLVFQISLSILGSSFPILCYTGSIFA